MTRLDQEERYHIYAMKRAGFSQKAIAREANKPKSRKLSSSLLFKINQKLEDDWSPEPIFGLVGFSQKKDASSVKKELISMFKPIKECVKTITADNGKEFAGHDNEPIKQSATKNFRLQITKNII
jgi:IS30 family transposase